MTLSTDDYVTSSVIYEGKIMLFTYRGGIYTLHRDPDGWQFRTMQEPTRWASPAAP